MEGDQCLKRILKLRRNQSHDILMVTLIVVILIMVMIIKEHHLNAIVVEDAMARVGVLCARKEAHNGQKD